jgi:hypothetical protein
MPRGRAAMSATAGAGATIGGAPKPVAASSTSRSRLTPERGLDEPADMAANEETVMHARVLRGDETLRGAGCSAGLAPPDARRRVSESESATFRAPRAFPAQSAQSLLADGAFQPPRAVPASFFCCARVSPLPQRGCCRRRRAAQPANRARRRVGRRRPAVYFLWSVMPLAAVFTGALARARARAHRCRDRAHPSALCQRARCAPPRPPPQARPAPSPATTPCSPSPLRPSTTRGWTEPPAARGTRTASFAVARSLLPLLVCHAIQASVLSPRSPLNGSSSRAFCS